MFRTSSCPLLSTPTFLLDSDVKHSILQIRVSSTGPLRCCGVENSGDIACAVLIERRVQVAAGTVAKQVRVVGRRTDRDGFGRATEGVAEFVGLCS